MILYRLLFIVLALTGVFILFRVIPVIAKIITEKPILHFPLTQDTATFVLPEAADYAIWQKLKGFRRTRIDMADPVISVASTGRQIPLRSTGGMITANDGSGTRRQLFTFSAPAAGEYRIRLGPGAGSVTGRTAFSAPGSDTEGASLEIRKPMPVATLVFTILGIILGFALVLGGIIGFTIVGRNS